MGQGKIGGHSVDVGSKLIQRHQPVRVRVNTARCRKCPQPRRREEVVGKGNLPLYLCQVYTQRLVVGRVLTKVILVKHPSQKRKRSPESDEDDERDGEEKDDEGELSDPISSESEEDDDDEPAFAATKSTPAKASGKARGTKAPAPKKARMAPKAATSRPRKTKLNIDASAVAKEAAISDDNALFSEFRRV